jgi:hypothetical protein
MLNQQSFCRSTRPNQLPYKGSPEAITSVIRGDTRSTVILRDAGVTPN